MHRRLQAIINLLLVLPKTTKRQSYRNISCITEQNAPLDVQVSLICRIPFLSPASLLFWTHRPIDRPGLRVDDNGISILHKSDRAPDTRLRNNVSYNKTMACTREPSVSNQS